MSSTAFGRDGEAFKFLLQSLRAATTRCNSLCCLSRFIVPLAKGQIIRSDIVPLRFTDSEVVALASSFAAPLQAYTGESVSRDQLDRLDEILKSASAGLLLRESSGTGDIRIDLRALSSLADAELEQRLSSITWISNQPLRRMRLVTVAGSRPAPDLGGAGKIIFRAAKALGIDMVVLDNPGHWLESGPYEHWREAFLPTKMVDDGDPEFVDRIVASVQSYDKPVDGIISLWEWYQPYVARAAKLLDLPVLAPPEALRIANDKYETSRFAGHDAFRASSVEEAVRLAQEKTLEFPLIVKPCKGHSSNGVTRVYTLSELCTAAGSINTERHGDSFLVEKYCSGPEVDANFVLLDGEVVFFDCSDDFPKTADDPDAYNGGGAEPVNFHEVTSVFPSALPQEEQDLIRDKFHSLLSELGIKNGVFHLEGRIEHSSVGYRQENGVLDLAPLVVNGDGMTGRSKEPTPWLLEINARAPGAMVTEVIESTWGVDYWGLALLFALGDKPRIRALSKPYKRGPQYTGVMVFISADYDPSCCEGIFDSDDICAELFARRPDLAKHVTKSGCTATKGQRIPHPSTGANTFIAYLDVFSRVSRREALELAAEVREEVRFAFR
ncbi:hypothetical protein F4679DRAFT_559530 [Xylaria curta]|nr:hypothetical protein F4679DRAFT_559530 [Xylaria curta]